LREKHGASILDALKAELVSAQRSGVGGTIVVWARSSLDILGAAWRLRVRVAKRFAQRELVAPIGGGTARLLGPFIATTSRDLLEAQRSLVRRPGPTLGLVSMLALGISVNLAAFSVTHGVLDRPFDYPGRDRLVSAWQVPVEAPSATTRVVPANYLEWRSLTERKQPLLVEMGAYMAWDFSVDRPPAEVIEGSLVTPGVFRTIGIAPLAGSVLGDVPPGTNERQIVISERLWERRFDRDPAILHGSLQLSGVPYDVVGIMPESFRFPPRSESELWARMPSTVFTTSNRYPQILGVVGRLHDDVGLEEANTELARISEELAARYEENEGWSGRLFSLSADETSEHRTRLWSFQLALALVFLLSAVNSANLQVADLLSRDKEFSLRMAMGADVRRIGRQVLIETVFVTAVALALGCAATYVSQGLLAELCRWWIGEWARPRLDEVVGAFALALGGCTAVIVGSVAVLSLWRRHRRQDTPRAERQRLPHVSARSQTRLVAFGVACSYALLVYAALLTHSLVNLEREPVGFDANDVITVELPIVGTGFGGTDDVVRFTRQALGTLARMPGVTSVGAALCPPLSGKVWGRSVSVADEPPTAPTPVVRYDLVTPGYFEALRMKPVAGAVFGERSLEQDPSAVVVNESFVRSFLGDTENAVGQKIWVGLPASRDSERRPRRTIVGVVEDVRNWGPARDRQAVVYAPLDSETTDIRHMNNLGLLIRVARPADIAPDGVAKQLREAFPGTPIGRTRSLIDVLQGSFAGERGHTALSTIMAILSWALAGIGIQVLTYQTILLRRREIGIRAALGADPKAILGSLLCRTLVVAAGGICLGVLITAATASRLAGSLYQVQPHDPIAYAASAVAVLGAAVAATWRPLRLVNNDNYTSFLQNDS
jgi:predicted permease